MKIFKIKVTENITGFVEIAADDLFVAENIARAALHDEGLGAFPNLETTSRNTDADGLYNKDLDTTNEKKNKTETAADGTTAYTVNYAPSQDLGCQEFKKERDKLRHLASDLRHMRDSESIGATKKDDNHYCNLIDQALDVIDDRITTLSAALEMLDRVREESE